MMQKRKAMGSEGECEKGKEVDGEGTIKGNEGKWWTYEDGNEIKE